MAKSDQVRFARVFHSLVAIFMLLAGGGLLAFGIWLSVTGNKGPFDLSYGGENIWRYVLVLPTVCIVFGVFLLVTALVSLIALAKNCLGKTFRIIYVIMAALILLALVFICIISSFLYHNKDNETVADFVRDAWKKSVIEDDRTICAIEAEFKCRGFENGDCTNCFSDFASSCEPEICVPCTSPQDPGVGCYDKLIQKLVSIFLPVAVVSGCLAGLQLIDMLLVCCL